MMAVYSIALLLRILSMGPTDRYTCDLALSTNSQVRGLNNQTYRYCIQIYMYCTGVCADIETEEKYLNAHFSVAWWLMLVQTSNTCILRLMVDIVYKSACYSMIRKIHDTYITTMGM